jgi:hypothetical protein
LEEIDMKKIFTCFFALIVMNNVYSLGIGELDTRNINEYFNTDSVKTVEGLSEGYKLFIDVISEMQIANDKNYNIEHIINTYVTEVGYDNKTNYDWIKYLTSDITAVKMKMTVFMNLLEMYINKQKEIIFFNKYFYKGVMILLDDYKNKGYNIKEEEIEDLYIHGDKISIWGKEYTVTTNNYTIVFYHDLIYSSSDLNSIRKIIVDKKSGTTYFDQYIGLTKEMILSLQAENRYDNGDILEYFNKDSYVFFYFENDIVKKIEYGNRLR